MLSLWRRNFILRQRCKKAAGIVLVVCSLHDPGCLDVDDGNDGDGEGYTVTAVFAPKFQLSLSQSVCCCLFFLSFFFPPIRILRPNPTTSVSCLCNSVHARLLALIFFLPSDTPSRVHSPSAHSHLISIPLPFMLFHATRTRMYA